jgi:hypothetical protein
MDLKSLLLEKRSAIVKKWCDAVLRTYPEQSQKFLRKQKDRFANPVGRSIFEGIQCLYDELLEDADSAKISLFLDNIIRIRAVQDFSPSRAVAFVFGLKKIIREEVANDLQQNGVSEEWTTFESRIDGLALLAFDVFAQCRQQMADIRVKEVRTRSEKLLKMAGLAYELPDDYEQPGKGGDLEEGQVNNGK